MSARLIPETANRADWPRLVAQAINPILPKDGYQRVDHMVMSTGAAIGNLGNFGGTALDSYLQIHSTNQLSTGIQSIIWGNHSKGVNDYIGKSRGANIGDIAQLTAGDRIYTQNIQAAGSFGAFGHVGYQRWYLDGTPDSGSEMHGAWQLGTGTGNNICSLRCNNSIVS